MGGDGGSVPKRKERVKSSTAAKKADREPKLDANERWKCCPLSNYFIRKPVMAGHYGDLFSKEGMLEFLIHQRNDALIAYHIQEDTRAAHSLKTRKDAIELKLVDNPDLDDSDPCWEKGDFVCPITGLETNGQHKFVFSWECGCVVSERALKECTTDDEAEKKCLVCEKPYKDWDLVIINPDNAKDLERNQAAFMARKMLPFLQGKTAKELGGANEFDDEIGSKESSSFGSSYRESTGSSARESRGDENDQAGPSTSSHRSRPGSSHSSGSKRDRSKTPHDKGPSTSSGSKRTK